MGTHQPPFTFAELLRRLRRRAEMTQEELADRAGLAWRGISDLERGARTTPHRETVERLADALGLNGDERAAFESAARGIRGAAPVAMEPPDQTRAHVEASGDGWHAVLRGTGDNNLPIQLTSFVGRTREVAEVKDLLATARLLTLTGAGGTGKTRLALQVAADVSEGFPDGVFFVNLAPLSDPEFVLSAIAQVLEVRETSERSLLDRLHAALRDKHLLLVLDNFEQVVQAAVPVAELLTTCPKLKMLVTSRMALHVRAEQEFAVPPLALPDFKHLPDLVALSQYAAVALFIQQARAVMSDFAVTNATAPAIAEICVRLDGLPLAIELAAARIKLFPPEALLARLGQRLAVLTGGARDVPARQQTLRATITWSYHLLDAQEQQLFRRLCVFVGGCSLEATEAVCAALGTGESQIVIDLLAALIDKSLLQQTEQEGKQSRFVLLETIREYGLEALAASGELESTRQAHAEYYFHLAQQAESELVGPQATAWLERLEREQDNLRATMQWSLEPAHIQRDPELALRLGQALAEFWMVRGPYREGQIFLEQALTANQEGATVLRARVLRTAADFRNLLDDVDRAEALCQESLALSRTLGDTRSIISGLALLAYIARNNGGHYQLARSLAEESLALARELGEKEIIAERLVDLADQVCVLGEYHEGQPLFEESLALFRELGNKRGLAHCLRTSAMYLVADDGDPTTIHDRLEESLTLCTELGDKIGLGLYSLYAGYAALVEGDPMTARVLVEQSLVLCREIGDGWTSIFAIAVLARIAARQGDYAAAWSLHEESLREVGAFKDHYPTAYCLEALAETMAAQGAAMWATQLWGTAEVEREHCGLPMFPVDRRDYEATVVQVRMQLGEAAFAAAWSEGRSLTPAEVAARGSSASPVGSPAPLSTKAPDV